jgi:hypothetical protein
MARAIDADVMLAELKPIDYKTEHSVVLISDVAKIMREWVKRQPTLTPPNEALTLEQLQEMDGEPVYSGKYKRWFLVTYFAVLNRSQLMDSTGTPFVADDCGPLYLCPPEGEEN